MQSLSSLSLSNFLSLCDLASLAVPPSAIMSPDRPNLWRILSDTSRIINAHSVHFSALLILFIFPLSLSTAAIYTLLPHPNPLETLYLRFLNIFSKADHQIPVAGESHLLPQLLYFPSTLFFSTCAGASITYSTFQGFYGRPVEFITALKSILVSFLPLLSTALLVDVITGLINFAYIGLLFWALNGLASIGFDMEIYYNEYFLVFVIATVILLVALVFYLQIEWSLAHAVVVVESECWGLAALKRSSYLVKGARGVMFLMMLFFAVLAGVLVIFYLKVAAIAGGIGSSEVWLPVFKIIGFTVFNSILLLYVVAATTVFFIYCKVSRHELEFEIDDKNLVGEHVRLPYDNVVFARFVC